MKKVISITGPTASGKTALALKIAHLFDLEIISVDSVQVYKHYDILSAKIKESEMEGVKHHLIDVLEPADHADVAWFQDAARNIIDNSTKPFLLVGGSGLYLNAILFDYKFDAPKRTANFADKFQDLSDQELYALLEANAKFSISDIHPNNRVRVLRKLELALSGSTEQDDLKRKIYDFQNFYLDIPRDLLKERLAKRLNQMFEQDILSEIKYLNDNYGLKNAIGYNEFIPFLKKEVSLADVQESILQNSLKLAKKQRTWFKNKLLSTFINVLERDFISTVAKAVHRFLYKERIILCGLPKVGKSTLGPLLAKKLGYEFIDLDAYLESKHGSISSLFASGEPYFRSIEAEAFLELKDRDHIVIALGGGALESDIVAKNLEGFLIYLTAPISVLDARENNVERPLLQNLTLQDLFLRRDPLFRQYANLIIENTDLNSALANIIKYLSYEDIDENISYQWS